MKIELNYPVVVKGRPKGTRLTYIVVGSETAQFDVPEYAAADTVPLVTHDKAKGGTDDTSVTVLRIGDFCYEPTVVRSGVTGRQGLMNTMTVRLYDLAEERLSDLKFTSIDLGGVHPKARLETVGDFARAMDGGVIRPFDDLGLSAVENASVDEYRRLLSAAVSSYVLVDGVPHVATREPFYAVEESRGSVYVSLERDRSDQRIVATFPVGMADEAEAFAADYAASIGCTFEHVDHAHVDHGLSAPDRSALDNVIRVAEAARRGFRSAFREKEEPDAIGRLLFETPPEDIADARRIHDFLSAPETHDDETVDAICTILRRAAGGASAKLFTSGGRNPIELAVDLWENRTIALAVTDRSPRP